MWGSRERQGLVQPVCDVIFLQSRSICASTGSNLNFPIFSCCRGAPPVPHFCPLTPLGCHTWRGEGAEPGEAALAGSLSPLISTAANEQLTRLGQQLCAHLTPLPAHKPVGDSTGDTVTPSHPWLGLIPVLFPFSISPKASGGEFQALEFRSAKVLLRAGNVWVLNECSKVSTASWGWVER